MNATLQKAIPETETAVENSAQNGRLRESQRQNAAESAQIIEVTFDRPTTLFRESLNKPPPEPETTSAEARSS
jgi:hypothetical protein